MLKEEVSHSKYLFCWKKFLKLKKKIKESRKILLVNILKETSKDITQNFPDPVPLIRKKRGR
jgi:hypothetical protein